MLSIDVLKITLHSAAAEEILKNCITFLDPGGINYVIIVGPTVILEWRVLSCDPLGVCPKHCSDLSTSFELLWT